MSEESKDYSFQEIIDTQLNAALEAGKRMGRLEAFAEALHCVVNLAGRNPSRGDFIRALENMFKQEQERP